MKLLELQWERRFKKKRINEMFLLSQLNNYAIRKTHYTAKNSQTLQDSQTKK